MYQGKDGQGDAGTVVKLSKIVLISTIFVLVACSSDGDEQPSSLCTTTAADSTFNGTTVNRIHSETVAPNTYEQITVRTVNTMDYMVHTHPNPKALIVLIAGGQLNAQIEGLNGTGQQATNASGNFLVRSAHLFAQQGFKVVTIDRPSDFAAYIGTSTSGSAYDSYRISSEHFTDLQAVINAENATLGLPVVIAGTSRGAISAVAQHNLADYVFLSAPVTSGGGSPVGSGGVMPADLGTKPVFIIWHAMDGCFVSTPAGSQSLVAEFANATGVQVSGGIDHPELSTRASNKECDGSKTYHGFSGIESCVVNYATDWLDQQLSM